MALFKVTVGGTIGTSEVFAYGAWFEDDVAASPSAFAAQATAWRTNHLTVIHREWYPNGVVWNRMRIQQFNPLTGLQLDAVDPSVASLPGLVTSGGSAILPYEVSACVSLRTGTATRSGRGRFYLPPPGSSAMTNGNDGTFGSGYIGAATAALANAYDIITTLTCRPVIVSKVGGAPWVLRDVIRFDMGNVPDSQRRRRNRLVEARTGHDIAI